MRVLGQYTNAGLQHDGYLAEVDFRKHVVQRVRFFQMDTLTVDVRDVEGDGDVRSVGEVAAACLVREHDVHCTVVLVYLRATDAYVGKSQNRLQSVLFVFLVVKVRRPNRDGVEHRHCLVQLCHDKIVVGLDLVVDQAWQFLAFEIGCDDIPFHREREY